MSGPLGLLTLSFLIFAYHIIRYIHESFRQLVIRGCSFPCCHHHLAIYLHLKRIHCPQPYAKLMSYCPLHVRKDQFLAARALFPAFTSSLYNLQPRRIQECMIERCLRYLQTRGPGKDSLASLTLAFAESFCRGFPPWLLLRRKRHRPIRIG